MPAAASSISESRTHPSWCHSTCLPRGIALMVNIIRHPQSVSDATAAHRDIQIKSWHSRTLAFNAGILVRQAIRESAVEATAPKSETESKEKLDIPNMSRNMTHEFALRSGTQGCRRSAHVVRLGLQELEMKPEDFWISSYRGSCGLRGPASPGLTNGWPWPDAPQSKESALVETVRNCDKVLNKELSTRGPILGFPKSKIAFSQLTEGWKSTTPYQAPLAPGAPAPSPIIQDGPCKTNLIKSQWHHMDPYGTWSVAIWCNMLSHKPTLLPSTCSRAWYRTQTGNSDNLMNCYLPVLSTSAIFCHVLPSFNLWWLSVTWDPCCIIPVQLDRCAHNAMT